MVDEEDLAIVVRMETVPVPAPATMPTRTGTRCHRTDSQRDSRTRHPNKALVGMGGMGGRRRCRVMVGLEVGLRDPREVGRTVGVLEADMGSLTNLNRTDGEGMVVVVVVTMVVQGVLKGVMVSTVPRMGKVAVRMGVVAHTMELREVGGVVVGSAVIYSCIFYLMLVNATMNDAARDMVHRVQISFTVSIHDFSDCILRGTGSMDSTYFLDKTNLLASSKLEIASSYSETLGVVAMLGTGQVPGMHVRQIKGIRPFELLGLLPEPLLLLAPLLLFLVPSPRLRQVNTATIPCVPIGLGPRVRG